MTKDPFKNSPLDVMGEFLLVQVLIAYLVISILRRRGIHSLKRKHQ